MELSFDQKCKVQRFVQSTCKKYKASDDTIFPCSNCPMKKEGLFCGLEGRVWTRIDFDGIWEYMRKEYLRRHPEALAELQRKHPNDSRYLHLL